MTYIIIAEKQIPATVSGAVRDAAWDYRHTKSITCEMTYEEAKRTFVNGLQWQLVRQRPAYTNKDGELVTPEPVTYDNADFDRVGSITDNLNGTVTVKMGEMTADEALAELMEVLNT